jgi:predicted dinucleotide-binding enzyme
MDIAIIGSGFIGSTLGENLAAAGHRVTFGVRRPEDTPVTVSGAQTASIGEAIDHNDVIIVAIPGGAVESLTAEHGTQLAGRLVIDATNQMGAPIANARALLPDTIRYARAFNTLGGENMADPVLSEGRADMFFSSPNQDRSLVEEVIEGVGLRPIFVGEDQEEIIDALFKLWIALAITQGRGRRLALHLMEG